MSNPLGVLRNLLGRGGAREKTDETASAEIQEVREALLSSQREFSRLGREMVRSGATLEAIQAAVSALGPTVERTADSLRAELMREHARERLLREEAERAALEDIVATLDGLEAGLEHGRELVQALAETQARLEDPLVGRWWRAMREATGLERPLPQVPVAEVEGWMEGLELTHRRLQDALARRGVTPIQAVGRPFDPYLHEAVAVESCPEWQDGLVVREERRGYRAGDRVLRLAGVVVCRAPEEEPAGPYPGGLGPAELPAEEREAPAWTDADRAGRDEDTDRPEGKL